MEDLKGIIDIGKRTVQLTIEAHPFELPLEPYYSRDKEYSLGTYRESLTSDSLAVPYSSSEEEPGEGSDGDEELFIMIQSDFGHYHLIQLDLRPSDGVAVTTCTEQEVASHLVYQIQPQGSGRVVS